MSTLKLGMIIVISALFTGCASVKMESKDASDKLKKFGPPSAGNAGLYLYRDSSFGGALKKDLKVNGRCIGESAPNVFFHTEVSGGKIHEISTESEFSPNTLALMVEAGKNYFIRQYIKVGLIIGGADLEPVSEEKGNSAVAQLDLAASGKCSK